MRRSDEERGLVGLDRTACALCAGAGLLRIGHSAIRSADQSRQGRKPCQVKAGVDPRRRSGQTGWGAAGTFTGVVFQDPVLTANAPSRMGGSVVTFTPGARTAWHAHPVGQTLDRPQRRRPHLLRGRGAPSAASRRHRQYPARHAALARRRARPAVLASGAVGSRRAGAGHRLGQARQRRGIQQAGPRRLITERILLERRHNHAVL